MHIEELYERLVGFALQRVRAGELTERGLARMCGISQPHMHNVLKHIRALSPASADRLMDALGVTLPELLWNSSGDGNWPVAIVPMVRNRIGPGMSATLTACRGSMPFSNRIIEHLVDPVVAQVGPDLVLPSMVSANDFILLDQNPEVCSRPRGDNCWVVAEEAGLRLRYVRLGGTTVYIANQCTVGSPGQWDSISLRGQKITDIVRARIVWIGREISCN
jgi:hypothetical protein